MKTSIVRQILEGTNFVKADKILTEIPDTWANGTGYFDNAVYAEVPEGEVWAGEAASGQAMVLIGTMHDTVVVFEHHSHQANGVLVCNTSNEFRCLFQGLLSTALTESEVLTLVGDCGVPNVGKRLKDYDYNPVS